MWRWKWNISKSPELSPANVINTVFAINSHLNFKGFCVFSCTVKRKADKSWTSVKGGQIHAIIITINSFLCGCNRDLSCSPDDALVTCLNIKARVANTQEAERQRDGGSRGVSPACCHLTTCYRSATAAGLGAARWERRQRWNSCAKPFPVHKCHVYFWSPGLVCTTSLSNKMVGVCSRPERR